MSLRVEIVDRVDRLRELALAWERLCAADPGADVFATPQWFLTWWEHFAGDARPLVVCDGDARLPLMTRDRRLHVIAVWDGASLAGIAPLIAARGRWRRCPVRLLTTPVNDHAPRASFPVSTRREDVLPRVLENLATTPGWDVLLLDGLPAEEGTASRVRQLAASLRLRSRARQGWTHAYLAVHGTWDDYLRGRGGHFRKHHGQSERALAKLGTVSTEHYTGTAIDEGIRRFIQVDAVSWKGAAGETLASAETVESFYTTVARRFAADELAEIWVLTVADEPIAGLVALRDRHERLYGLKTSFKASFRHNAYSPGVTLIARLVREACESKAAGVDFLTHLPFVDRWASAQREFEGLTIFHRHPYARALALVESLRARLRPPPERSKGEAA